MEQNKKSHEKNMNRRRGMQMHAPFLSRKNDEIFCQKRKCTNWERGQSKR